MYSNWPTYPQLYVDGELVGGLDIVKVWKCFLVFVYLGSLTLPLHPNISIYILNTLLFTFPLVLTRRIHLTIKASVVDDHFLSAHDLKEGFSSFSVRQS